MDPTPWSCPRLSSSKGNLMFQQFLSQFRAGIRISGDGTASFTHSLAVAQKVGTHPDASPTSGPPIKHFTEPRSMCEMEILLISCNLKASLPFVWLQLMVQIQDLLQWTAWVDGFWCHVLGRRYFWNLPAPSKYCANTSHQAHLSPCDFYKVYLAISQQQKETIRDYIAIILQSWSLEFPGLWLKLLKAAQFPHTPEELWAMFVSKKARSISRGNC